MPSLAGDIDSAARIKTSDPVVSVGKVLSCNAVDERVNSNDPAIGRLVLQVGAPEADTTTADCTAFIIPNGAFLTAGHCIDDDNIPLMVEFNVPSSDNTGHINFAHPDDQYPIDSNSLVWDPNLPTNDCGNDWGVFRAFRNSNTSLRADQAQGAFYRLTNTTNLASGHGIRIRGFGRDNDPPSVGWSGCPQCNSTSQTQQQSGGTYSSESFDSHRSIADIAVGNSGSPMVDLATGLAFGIVTHGILTDNPPDQIPFCTNCGQSFEVADVSTAINNAPGANTRYVDVGHPEPLEDGTLFRPYDSINEAINAVPSGGIVSVAPGTYSAVVTVNKNITLVAPVGAVTLGQDITVQSGATLSIATGTVLRFASARQIKVYGTLNAVGVTFTSNSSWKGVRFESGSTGDLDDVVIDNIQLYSTALYVDNADVDVLDSQIGDASTPHGVTVTGASATLVMRNSNVHAESNAVNSSNDAFISLKNDTIKSETSFAVGSYFDAYVSMDAYGAGPTNPNSFLSGGTGLRADGDAVITAGSTYSGYNHMCDLSSYSVKATSGATVYVKDNYWEGVGSVSAIPGVYTSGGAAVYHTTSNGVASCGVFSKTELLTAGDADLGSGNLESVLDEPGKMLEAALKLARSPKDADRRTAVGALSQLIARYPSSSEARSAVAEISHLHRLLADPAIGVFLEEVAEMSTVLRPTALGKLTGIYERQGALESALRTAEALANEYPRTWHAFNGHVKQFELHRRGGRWSDAARVMSEMSPTSATESALAAALYREYKSELQSAGASEPKNMEASESSVGDAGPVAVAYPNPFNPRTTIQYRVSQEGHVRLAVYDILGRELKVLVNGTMTSGAHTAELDGSDLPSGTYLFRLEADGTTHQGSILLVK